MYVSDKPALIPHLLLIALSVAPLVIHVPTNFNVVATASLAVYCGCWRSVKATGEISIGIVRSVLHVLTVVILPAMLQRPLRP